MATLKHQNDVDYHGPETAQVTVAGAGGALAIVFDVAYEFPPAVLIVKPLGAAAGGSYTAGSITTTGFTLTIATETNADFLNRVVPITWFACARS